jgi:tRNA isopentenyl-2-thiomethyl-A-37 hydroxylase MiaE
VVALLTPTVFPPRRSVIKGRCGSAISAVETFRQLLGPYLKTELPDEMSNLIKAPLSHLREAIEWCHRRQVPSSLSFPCTPHSHRIPPCTSKTTPRSHPIYTLFTPARSH